MISSKADEIKSRLLEFCTLFSFDYNGKTYGVDPFNLKLFRVYTGENGQDVDNIDDVMNLPFIEGKSLNELADKILIIDW